MAEFILPNAASAAYDIQAQPDAGDFLALAGIARATGVVSGCLVTAGPAILGLAVDMAEGWVSVNNEVVFIAADGWVLDPADPVLGRLDLIVVATDGAVPTAGVLPGTPAETPLYSSAFDTFVCVLLAAVYVPPTVVEVTSDMVLDKRIILRPKVELGLAVALGVAL